MDSNAIWDIQRGPRHCATSPHDSLKDFGANLPNASLTSFQMLVRPCQHSLTTPN